MGEAAVTPLIGIVDNNGVAWQFRRNAAAVLADFAKNPSPMSPAVSRIVERLMKALNDHDNAVIVGACEFLIRRIGEPGSEDTLIEALRSRGDSDTATVFLRSRNSGLELAARQWASEHGYKIVSYQFK